MVKERAGVWPEGKREVQKEGRGPSANSGKSLYRTALFAYRRNWCRTNSRLPKGVRKKRALGEQWAL